MLIKINHLCILGKRAYGCIIDDHDLRMKGQNAINIRSFSETWQCDIKWQTHLICMNFKGYGIFLDPCFPRIDGKHAGNSVLHSYILFGWTEFHNLFTFYLIQAMSAKKISSSNSVRPSIEAASNWEKPSLNYSSNDTMSNDDLIDVITLRLTRMGELEQENIILKRKLNRYCLFYFLFVAAVKLSYPIKPGCFH